MIKLELIDIVDENGKFTGQIMEREEAHDRNLLHNEISVFVINSRGQVLLQKRSSTKRFKPNKWGLCSGHVNSRENLEEATIRELKEELGLNISRDDLVSFGNRNIVLGNSNSHITYFYYVVSNLSESDFVIQEDELSEVKWLEIDEVIKMLVNEDESLSFSKDRLYLFEEIKKMQQIK